MLYNEFDFKLMNNIQQIFDPSSMLSFNFNGVVMSFLEILDFDLE